MRLHDEAVASPPGAYGERERAIATAGSLAAIRFRLETWADVARGRLDLTFARGGTRVDLPGAYVDLAYLAAGTPAAITFPRVAAKLFDESSAAAVVAVLVPHLQLLIRARTVPLEATIRLAEGDVPVS
jgi:hypothetical protein